MSLDGGGKHRREIFLNSLFFVLGFSVIFALLGVHVDDGGKVFIKEDRLYRLIEDPNGWGEYTLEIIIEGPGVRVFAFTFG